MAELQYITPIANVSSILDRGILSHRRAQPITHQSIADPKVQDRRSKVRVPGGRPLHEYVNLYISARNPMMFRRRDQNTTLCVLRVNTGVLDLPGVVVTDRNAASDYRRFAPAPIGLAIVDRDLVFAEFWTHPDDQIKQWRHASIKCAEILVPDSVAPEMILGAWVSGEVGQNALAAAAPGLKVAVDRHLFMQ